MLTLHKHAILANIKNRYATVIYAFDFQNMNKNGSNELKFELTIEPSAFISKFEANIDGVLFVGETKEKETASQEYSEAKEKDENAILVSQVNKNITNVFEIKTNVTAKSKVSLTIQIEQYLQKTFELNQLNIQILRNFSKYNIQQKFDHISFRFLIEDISGIYDIDIPNSDNNIVISERNVDKMKQKYEINGNITAKSSINELALKYKTMGEQNASHILYDNNTNTFCHIISDIVTDSIIMNEKDANEGANNDIKNNILIPRRVMFVIDRSGSMSGSKWDKTISATLIAIKQLRNNYDRFGIILFDNNIEILPYKDMRGCILTNDKTINDSINILKSKTASGSTNINAALLKAIELIKIDVLLLNNDINYKYNFFMNQICLITDGEPNNGERDVKKIVTNVKTANELNKIDKYNNKISIFTFGVGKDGNDSSWMNDLNHSFLKILSVNNNGFYKRIKQTSADTTLEEYFNILSKPMLLNINIEYTNKNIYDLTQNKFNSLYFGNDLIICGKLKSKQNFVQLKISAITGIKSKENDKLITKPINICKEMKIEINTNKYENNRNNTERIFAYLKLQELATKQLIQTDMIEIDDDEKKEAESLPLSIALKYQFVTPWTSMIVVKKTDDKVIAKSVISDKPRSMEKIKGSYISRSSITTKILAACSSQTSSIYPTPISSIKSHSLGRRWSRPTSKPGMKPGMGSGKHKPGMTRLRTVWITQPSQRSFKDDYAILKINMFGQFSKYYQCKRKKDKLILSVNEIHKALMYRIHPSNNIRQSLLKSMQTEIDIMRRLKHAYILNVYETYETCHMLRIVMEDFKSDTLFDRIISNQRFDEKYVKIIIKMICEALFYMHDQHRIIHCDLHPNNILFINESNIKIIGFGMSKIFPRLISLRSLCDTPYYISPESISGNYSHAADMWSVGVIVYLMLFKTLPFYVESNKYFGASETKKIYDLISKGLDTEKKKTISSKLSKNAADFILNLLEKDLTKRLTAKEALQHVWLTHTSSDHESKNDNDQVVSTELKEDSKSSVALKHIQFKFALNQCFTTIYRNMKPKQFEHLKSLCATMDKEGNNNITYAQFEQVLMKYNELKLDTLTLQKSFKQINIENMGIFDFKNLLNAMIHDYLVRSEIWLYAAFRDMDCNESGKITTVSLKKKLCEMNTYDNFHILLQIIDDFDLDNDGRIDYECFLRILHADFNEIPNWFWCDNEMKQELESEQKMDKISKLINLNKVVKKGYMEKKDKLTSWKKLWCVLQNNGIMKCCFDKNEDSLVGMVNCTRIKKLISKTWNVCIDQKQYGIIVCTALRDWTFLCENVNERDQWIKALQKMSDQ